MKLLKVTAKNFKNCIQDYTIDLVAKSRKTTEDKEYEPQEIALDLFVYNTMAFIGKNASGKTSAVELLDACYSILGEFRLEGKLYSYEDVALEITFYESRYIYRYDVLLGVMVLLEIKLSSKKNISIARSIIKPIPMISTISLLLKN